MEIEELTIENRWSPTDFEGTSTSASTGPHIIKSGFIGGLSPPGQRPRLNSHYIEAFVSKIEGYYSKTTVVKPVHEILLAKKNDNKASAAPTQSWKNTRVSLWKTFGPGFEEQYLHKFFFPMVSVYMVFFSLLTLTQVLSLVCKQRIIQQERENNTERERECVCV
jgi:hypothetical protein